MVSTNDTIKTLKKQISHTTLIGTYIMSVYEIFENECKCCTPNLTPFEVGKIFEEGSILPFDKICCLSINLPTNELDEQNYSSILCLHYFNLDITFDYIDNKVIIELGKRFIPVICFMILKTSLIYPLSMFSGKKIKDIINYVSNTNINILKNSYFNLEFYDYSETTFYGIFGIILCNYISTKKGNSFATNIKYITNKITPIVIKLTREFILQ